MKFLLYSRGGGTQTLFVDIGANRGDAIQSILMRRPDATVIAFEPNPLLIQKVKKLYDRDPRVEIKNYGLGNDSSTFDLYIPFYNNYMFDGLASFKEENASDWLKTRLYGYQNEKLAVKKMGCTVKRLDDFSLDPFFIKIDVQGFEYEVLLGAKKTIEASKPIILIETPGKKELDFLYSMGYKPFIFFKNKLFEGTNCRDYRKFNIFFIPERMISTLRNNIQIVIKEAA